MDLSLTYLFSKERFCCCCCCHHCCCCCCCFGVPAAGLDFIWQVYLRNPDDRVAGLMEKQLIYLYRCHTYLVSAAPLKKALIR